MLYITIGYWPLISVLPVRSPMIKNSHGRNIKTVFVHGRKLISPGI